MISPLSRNTGNYRFLVSLAKITVSGKKKNLLPYYQTYFQDCHGGGCGLQKGFANQLHAGTSVAGPVIQATGRLEFEDGLWSGDFVSGFSYHMSVRTGLPDHTMQTKFQSQWPSDVETQVTSI
jgi:hypothetical protein